MFNSRGFTLVEVLISMVILAIGLLGLAAMQGMSLRDNQDAYNYQQATLLAYEMQDRIKGNSGANWIPPVLAFGTGDCTQTAPCDIQTMANNDYGYWKRNVAAMLPAPKTGNIVEISSSAVANTPCKKTYSTSLCLITRWARNNSASSNKSSKLSDTATYYLEVTP